MRTYNQSFRDQRNRLSPSLWSPLLCVHRLSSRASLSGARFGHRRLDDILSQSLGVHGNSAAAVLEDGGNGERTCSWAGLCCAHGHGAYPHQCRDQTDAVRGVRPHSRHHDPSTYNELLTALRCGVDAPTHQHDSKDACENYARAIYNNTDDIGIVQPTAVPDL